MQLSRRNLIGSLSALGLSGQAFAQDMQDTTVTSTLARGDVPLDSWVDIYGRPTAKVTINGKPFRFLVDTGSAATVIAARHIPTLDPPLLGNVTVIGATGSAVMPRVELETFETGVVTKEYLPVAVLPDTALRREDGIIGADVFAGRRLSFDLKGRTVGIEASRREGSQGNMRVRNGLLAEVAGMIGSIPTRMMLDTGAKSCIANMALSAQVLKRYPMLGLPKGTSLLNQTGRASIYGVTGQRLDGQLIGLPLVDMRAFRVQGATCIAADAPIFDLWGLKNQPTLIVGVDLLSRLDSFSIDYGTKAFDAKLAEAMMARNLVELG